MADGAWRGVHLARRARRDARSVERNRSQRHAGGALDLHVGTDRPLLPGSDRVQPLSPDPAVARGVAARADAREASPIVRHSSALWIAALAGDLLLASSSRAQTAVPPDHTATYRADSLRLSGRPWHAAETLLAAARRDPNPNAFLIVEGAKAEVHARRYEHARTLLAGQPWLLDYLDGEALAVLAQAEFGVARFAEAATHFQMARARAPAARVPLLAVRAGVAFDAADQADSAAAAFAAARAGGKLASIDPWLRVRQARVTRDTAAAGELVVSSGQLREAVRAYAAAARDSAARPLAIYRRARVLVRLGDSTALSALSGFAARYPTDSAAPGALYILGDMNDGRDDWVQAGRWYGELIKRYPADARASLARFRLAAHAEATGDPESAASLYQAEIDAAGPQRTAARFWVGKMAEARGDSAQ